MEIKYLLASLLVLGSLLISNAETNKVKRQIYREQVLPFRGGKVPEDAFRADRLALNRLNKEGIAVPDGVLLEHRHVHNHPHSVRHDPEDESSILRVVQQPDNRYVPEEGRYHNAHEATVASTYLIRRPIEQEQTNIRTPEQQRPLHQFINQKQHSSQPNRFHYEPLTLPHHRAAPVAKNSYSQSPIHYTHYHRQHQQKEGPPLVYHAVPVPFELPNKEVQEEDYFPKNTYGTYPVQQHEPAKVDWHFGSGSDVLDKLSLDFNSLLPTNEFDFQPTTTHFRYYESPQLPSYNHYFGFFGEGLRFSRKTEEGYAKGAEEVSPAQKSARYGDRISKRQRSTKVTST